MKKSVIIAGVGGQGVITAANILAKSAVREGYNVIASELHGMAQRGGNVECSVRIGDIFSPIVANTTADALIAFEPVEALRNLNKVKIDGVVLTDINPVIPPLISIGIGKYTSLEEIFESISAHHRLIKINADNIARNSGSILTKNVVMLGALQAIGILPLKERSILDVIMEIMPEKYIDMNLEAFETGKTVVEKISEIKKIA